VFSLSNGTQSTPQPGRQTGETDEQKDRRTGILIDRQTGRLIEETDRQTDRIDIDILTVDRQIETQTDRKTDR
jgi:hypothetical protein